MFSRIQVLNNPLVYTDPSGHSFWKEVKKAVSKVMDDWLGIEQLSFGINIGIGIEAGFDFRNGVHITNVGVGFGIGGYVNISTPSFDISSGNIGAYVSMGYDSISGYYTSGGVGAGPVVSVSATYYSSGIYSIGTNFGFDGIASIGFGYSNVGGVSANTKFMGARYAYNFDTHRGRVGMHLDVEAMKDKYSNEISLRQLGNGYGAAGGWKPFNRVIDFMGTIASGYRPAELHDVGYETFGASKARIDFRLFSAMPVGAFPSNFGAKDPNGIPQATLGLVLAPLYYGAVSVGGHGAFETAQQ